jgi:SAM-dependent methyltransferase
MIEQGGLFREGEVASAEAVAQWDAAAREFASFFAEGVEYFHKHIINPCLLDVLGCVKGARVCDLACGDGHFARGLVDRTKGAVDVVCVDASQEMVRIARERSEGHGDSLRFLVADAGDLSALQTASFDVVVCNMALMDIADYRAAISEAARILKPGGVFAFSILHPCFMTPDSGWIRKNPESRDPANKVAWRVNDYRERLVEKGRMKREMTVPTYCFHRTLEDYFSVLGECGFVVVDLREPAQSEKLLADDPWSSPDLKIAMFLVVKALRGTVTPS